MFDQCLLIPDLPHHSCSIGIKRILTLAYEPLPYQPPQHVRAVVAVGGLVEGLLAEAVALLHHLWGALRGGTGSLLGSRLSTSRSHIVPAPYQISRHCYSPTPCDQSSRLGKAMSRPVLTSPSFRRVSRIIRRAADRPFSLGEIRSFFPLSRALCVCFLGPRRRRSREGRPTLEQPFFRLRPA